MKIQQPAKTATAASVEIEKEIEKLDGCVKCGADVLERRAYCAEHWAEYMRDYRTRAVSKRERAAWARGVSEGVAACLRHLRAVTKEDSASGYEIARRLEQDINVIRITMSKPNSFGDGVLAAKDFLASEFEKYISLAMDTKQVAQIIRDSAGPTFDKPEEPEDDQNTETGQ